MWCGMPLSDCWRHWLQEQETSWGHTSVGTFVMWWEDVFCVLLLYQNNYISHRKHRFPSKMLWLPTFWHIGSFSVWRHKKEGKRALNKYVLCDQRVTHFLRNGFLACANCMDPTSRTTDRSCSSLGLGHLLHGVRHCAVQTVRVPVNSVGFTVSVWLPMESPNSTLFLDVSLKTLLDEISIWLSELSHHPAPCCGTIQSVPAPLRALGHLSSKTYTMESSGSRASELETNRTSVFPGSPACTKQIRESLNLHQCISQIFPIYK